MDDLALLCLRLTAGSLLAGHGAQKLMGWFGGHGLQGTSGWMESIGLRPGRPWALTAGLSEFGGGLLMALGFLNPLGPIGALGSMGMATGKVHWGKPIWTQSGGAELPLMYAASAVAIMLSGPDKYSLDRALDIELPRWIALPGLAVTAATIAYGLVISQGAQQEPRAEEQQAEEGPLDANGAAA